MSSARPAAHQQPGQVMGLFSSTNKQVALLALLLAITVIAVYYPVTNQPFSNFDDDGYVVDNAPIQEGVTLQSIKWSFTTFYAANWHPLTWLSHALDYQLFQLNAEGHHIHNLLLQVINAILLFLILWRATGYVGRSFMVAVMFALHPLNVETVAWISERKNLLSMLFFLLALGAYRWYATRPRAGRYLVVAFLYALALMAKPQVITFPLVLLLWDYWPLGRMFPNVAGATAGVRTDTAVPPQSLRWLLLEKVPLLLLSAGSAVLTMKAQFGWGAQTWFPKPVRIGNAILSYATYIRKMFWPSDLALFYPHPGNDIRWAHVAVAFFLLAAITIAVLFYWRRRYFTVGWLWFAGTLVPTIGIVQVGSQAMADRYAYLSLIGLFIMLCWGVSDLAGWIAGGVAGWRRIESRSLAAVSVIILLALSVATRRQVGFWTDSSVNWSHALQVTENNWMAEDLVGASLIARGKLEEAMPHIYRANHFRPKDPVSNLNIGAYLQLKGNSLEAIERFKKTLAPTAGASPQQKFKAYSGMGYAYRDLGDYADSRDALQMAVGLKPTDAKAWTYLGVAAQKTGDRQLAIQAYLHAIDLQPSAWRYLLLSQAYEENQQPDKAQRALEQAKLISPNFEESQQMANDALAGKHD